MRFVPFQLAHTLLKRNVQLLAMVPEPVLAVVLLFPITEQTEQVRREDEAMKDPKPVDPTVLWIKQTVSDLSCSPHLLVKVLPRSRMRAEQWDCEFTSSLTRSATDNYQGFMLLPMHVLYSVLTVVIGLIAQTDKSCFCTSITAPAVHICM
jgi:hypothetical protein